MLNVAHVITDLDVLLVEDSESDAKLVVRELRRVGYAPNWERVETLVDLRNALQRRHWQVVICDSRGPQIDAMKAVEAVNELSPGVPFLVVSGQLTPDLEVKVRSAGAVECIPKGEISRLSSVLARELPRRPTNTLAARVLAAQEIERRKIARSLHDEFGQLLTALRHTLLAAQQAQGPALTEKLAEAQKLVDQATQQIRDVALELWPTILDDLGLPSALRWLAERQTQWSGVDVRVELDDVGRLAPHLEAACFRVAQTALTNVVRHAAAKQAVVRLTLHPKVVELSVSDDGRGFDTAAAWRRARAGDSLGLISIREQVTAAGGTMKLTSGAGAGTTLVATLPLAEEA